MSPRRVSCKTTPSTLQETRNNIKQRYSKCLSKATEESHFFTPTKTSVPGNYFGFFCWKTKKNYYESQFSLIIFYIPVFGVLYVGQPLQLFSMHVNALAFFEETWIKLLIKVFFTYSKKTQEICVQNFLGSRRLPEL